MPAVVLAGCPGTLLQLLGVKRNSLLLHHSDEHGTGPAYREMPRFLLAGPLAEQTVSHVPASRRRTLPPGGWHRSSAFAGAVLQRLRRDSGLTPRYAGKNQMSISSSISSLNSNLNQPLGLTDFQRHLWDEQRPISSGVLQAILMHALQLRRGCREVFLLCDIQRHSLADAAAILGISQAAGKRRLQSARRRMEDVIERLCGPRQEIAGPNSD